MREASVPGFSCLSPRRMREKLAEILENSRSVPSPINLSGGNKSECVRRITANVAGGGEQLSGGRENAKPTCQKRRAEMIFMFQKNKNAENVFYI